MGNVFSDAPSETEPREIISGDFLTWKRTDLGTDYSNSLYTLSYKARLEGTGSTVITITAAASGDDYLVEEAAATTAAYTAGVYHWDAYITRDSDSERVTIDSGTFEVLADRAVATTDPRSHAKKMVDLLESLLEGKAASDVSSYSIQGRSLTKMGTEELIKWRNYYKREVLQAEKIERRKNGKGTGGLIKVSFN